MARPTTENGLEGRVLEKTMPKTKADRLRTLLKSMDDLCHGAGFSALHIRWRAKEALKLFDELTGTTIPSTELVTMDAVIDWMQYSAFDLERGPYPGNEQHKIYETATYIAKCVREHEEKNNA